MTAPVCVAPSQVRLHRVSELVAVLGLAPLLVYVALAASPPRWARTGLVAAAIGTVLIDGYLLTQWRRADGQPVR